MNHFKIWYLSSEVSPFAKTGGLGDVTGALPKSLKEKDQEVRVIMPKYKMINERKYILREVIRLKDIPVALKDKSITVNAKSAFLPESKVQIYFIENNDLFGRNSLYTDPATGKDYPDNAQRFAYFCKGALETLKILSWKPDIIHCNDWQTAFVPLYLKTIYSQDDFLKDIKTVFTIHNLSYQGIFPLEMGDVLDLDPELWKPGGELEHNGQLNLMKGAILHSDWITTVSPTYAEEISSDETRGYGLEKALKKRRSNFTGILNGVDYDVWSPDTDKFIPFTYSEDDLSGKAQNKQALLTRVNMEYSGDIPVFGMISRVVEQKGFGLLIDAIDDLMKMEAKFIILGTGDPEMEQKLKSAEQKNPDRLSFNTAFDETLAHMIEAGADFFLMPSQYEPCGMNQMYSLKYGTVPIVFKTGGLADTISEFDPSEGSGNGLVFSQYDRKEFVQAIKRGMNLFKNREIWQELQKKIMHEDHSWEKKIDEYLGLYATILEEK